LAYRLNSIHNVRFLVRLAGEIRAAILDGTFAAQKEAFLAGYQVSDPAVAREQRARRAAALGRPLPGAG
jgi:queuine tRNA-ribosyltransferase